MAVALSLRYGAGDVRWFHRLSRDEQIDVMALHQVEVSEAKDRTKAHR
jgi:hypothetical protein